MSDIKDKSKSLVEKIRSNKKIQYLLVVTLAVIVILIFVSSFFKSENIVQKQGVDNYVTQLENSLENTLGKVEGAGEVSVVITIESGMETVLAMEKVVKETSSGIETKETPVIVNGKPIVLKEKYPKIIGVLIVAKGANNISVLTKIQQATISLLDININQIEILSMK